MDIPDFNPTVFPEAARCVRKIRTARRHLGLFPHDPKVLAAITRHEEVIRRHLRLPAPKPVVSEVDPGPREKPPYFC